jgi:dihydroxyacetone kinase-like protein
LKKLINDPADVVIESLEGLVASRPDLLRLDAEHRIVYRADAPLAGRVAVVSGGGSGHEPLHAGFVGRGMLDAACAGEIFTSPTPDQVLAAARRVDGGAGVLFIVKNYSGDVMNFEMAVELAHAEGRRMATVLIDDDVAVSNSLYTQGRRGVGTTLVAEKACGAAAARGDSLAEVAAVGRKVNVNGRSMGVALTSCTTPARGEPTFSLGEDEMEVGIGIHGEPGRERMALRPADEVADMLTAAILDDPLYVRGARAWDGRAWVDVELRSEPLAAGESVLAFVNGMGGTPLSELYVIYRRVAEVCDRRGLRVVRSLVGSYVTSLDMQGCAITLVRMDDELLRLWDAPVETPALRG